MTHFSSRCQWQNVYFESKFRIKIWPALLLSGSDAISCVYRVHAILHVQISRLSRMLRLNSWQIWVWDEKLWITPITIMCDICYYMYVLDRMFPFCGNQSMGYFCKYCNKLLSEFSVKFPNYFMASLFLFLRYTRKFAISALIMMKELCCGSRGSTDNFNLYHEVKVLW